MFKYETLQSEKFWVQSLEKQAIELRAEQNRRATQDLTSLFLGVIAIVLGIYIANSMPLWLPEVQTFVHNQFTTFVS